MGVLPDVLLPLVQLPGSGRDVEEQNLRVPVNQPTPKGHLKLQKSVLTQLFNKLIVLVYFFFSFGWAHGIIGFDTVNSKLFIGKFCFQFKWKFELLTVHFEHDVIRGFQVSFEF